LGEALVPLNTLKNQELEKKPAHNTIKPRRESLIYAYLVGALRWIDMYLYKPEKDTKGDRKYSTYYLMESQQWQIQLAILSQV